MRLILCLLLAASAVQAGTPANSEAPVKGLPFDQLQAIRRIGQNVIQAQKDAAESSGNKTAADNDSLAQLNATLNNLIAAEKSVLTPSSQSQPIAVNASGNAAAIANNPQPPAGKRLIVRIAAESQAFDVVSSLRQEASQLQAQNNKPAQVQVTSGGFPVGEQHGRLYDAWADKLEAILTDNRSDRLAQLQALQAQLAPKHSSDFRPPIEQRTPTIQAMPWINPESAVTNQSITQ